MIHIFKSNNYGSWNMDHVSVGIEILALVVCCQCLVAKALWRESRCQFAAQCATPYQFRVCANTHRSDFKVRWQCKGIRGIEINLVAEIRQRGDGHSAQRLTGTAEKAGHEFITEDG